MKKIFEKFWFILFLFGFIFGVMFGASVKNCDYEIISPLPDITPTPTPTDIPSISIKYFHLEGLASWYGTGEDECLGCREDRIMANGERLDDDKKTIACAIGGSCKYFDVGDEVEILNLENMMVVRAVVTDRGGFARYGRIIDMTKAVRDSINCDDLCKVRVTKL